MQLRSILMVAPAAVFALSLSVPGMAQEDGNFMVRYGSNLATSPLITTMTNTGGGWGEHLPINAPFAVANGQLTPGSNTLISNGNICVNIYAFSADEQLQWCCQCTLTPNALGSFSTADIQGHLLTGIGNSQAALNIKLVATALGPIVNGQDGRTPTTQVAACDATTVGLSTIPGQFFPDPIGPVVLAAPTGKGLAAWARNNGSETAYTHSTLSSLELQHNSQFCAFNKVNGSGVGYCNTGLFTQTAASTTVAQCPRATIL